jgi:hypothetical protein
VRTRSREDCTHVLLRSNVVAAMECAREGNGYVFLIKFLRPRPNFSSTQMGSAKSLIA